MLSFDYNEITYHVPDKIVVLKAPCPGLEWFCSNIITIEGFSKESENRINFSFYENAYDQVRESYFLFADFETMKYISYEKFLKLKAFA